VQVHHPHLPAAVGLPVGAGAVRGAGAGELSF
jgi:hypothetical protein